MTQSTIVNDSYFRQVVAAAWAGYITSKMSTPDMETILKYAGLKKATPRLLRVLESDEFKQAMEDRGANWGKLPSAVSPEQMNAIQIITNPTDRRPMNAKLRSAGINYTKYRGWLKQPAFAATMRTVTESMLDEHIGDVHTALTHKAMSGDMRAIEYYYQISGRYDPNSQQVINLQNIINSLLEILTVRITDQTLLNQISSDIGNILEGNAVPAITQFTTPVGIEDAIEVPERSDFSFEFE